MALVKCNTTKIMCLTALVLVLAIMSSVSPSCHAAVTDAPSGSVHPLTETCYTYRFCNTKGCERHCAHKNKTGGYCKTPVDEALWSLWKLRNELCFQDGKWCNVAQVLGKMVGMLKNWKLLCSVKHLGHFLELVSALEDLIKTPERLTWLI
ncbi:hypothetical protein ACP4OV_027276 [Aristida adscensionis]